MADPSAERPVRRRGAPLLRSSYFTNTIGDPLDITVAVHHLIFGGVLHEHPNLKLVLSRGGDYLPAYSGRIDHAASARHPRPQRCPPAECRDSTYSGLRVNAAGQQACAIRTIELDQEFEAIARPNYGSIAKPSFVPEKSDAARISPR
jgi:hypothetical protein